MTLRMKQVMANADNLIAAREAVDAWQPLAGHPHVAALRTAFVNSDIGGAAALYVAHEYHAGAVRPQRQPPDAVSALQQ